MRVGVGWEVGVGVDAQFSIICVCVCVIYILAKSKYYESCRESDYIYYGGCFHFQLYGQCLPLIWVVECAVNPPPLLLCNIEFPWGDTIFNAPHLGLWNMKNDKDRLFTIQYIFYLFSIDLIQFWRSNAFLLDTLGKDKLSHGSQIKLVKNGYLSLIYIADK